MIFFILRHGPWITQFRCTEKHRQPGTLKWMHQICMWTQEDLRWGRKWKSKRAKEWSKLTYYVNNIFCSKEILILFLHQFYIKFVRADDLHHIELYRISYVKYKAIFSQSHRILIWIDREYGTKEEDDTENRADCFKFSAFQPLIRFSFVFHNDSNHEHGNIQQKGHTDETKRKESRKMNEKDETYS